MKHLPDMDRLCPLRLAVTRSFMEEGRGIKDFPVSAEPCLVKLAFLSSGVVLTVSSCQRREKHFVVPPKICCKKKCLSSQELGTLERLTGYLRKITCADLDKVKVPLDI